jgi:hypothetical protein
MFDSEGRNMFSDRTDNPVSSTSVKVRGGEVAE